GDVVTAVAGHGVASNTDLRAASGLLRVGDAVTIDLLRDGRRAQRRATLADTLPAAPAAGRRGPSEQVRH
ncbi:MAG: hypothetical protein KGJ72_16730, partial [Gammaproteobacteria bacterium]|nr:hypothetical protein [Gammaproteobacteria bacterium]